MSVRACGGSCLRHTKPQRGYQRGGPGLPQQGQPLLDELVPTGSEEEGNAMKNTRLSDSGLHVSGIAIHCRSFG
jgi:hypothetical protein